jgi:hypothetical protein
MTAYWVLFFLPFVGVLMPLRLSKIPRRLAWLGMVAIAAVTIGFRHQVGGDWDTYLDIYGALSTSDFLDAIATTDPGYAALNWLSGQLGWGVYGVNLVCGIVFAWGTAKFAARQPIPWMAWVICIPYLLIVVAMGYTRQGIALGLIFWGLTYLQDGRRWIFALLVAIAGLFHKTAILMMTLAFVLHTGLGWVNAIALLAALATAAIGLLFTYIEVFWSNYVESNMSSEGGAIRVWMNAVPAGVMLAMGLKWQRRWPDPGHWRYITWASIGCVFLVGFSSTAVDRAALYLAPLQVYVWARFPLLFPGLAQRAAVAVGICMTYAAVLFVWLTWGLHAQYWLPYRNILFE